MVYFGLNMLNTIFSLFPQKEKADLATEEVTKQVRKISKKARGYQLAVVEQMLKLTTNAFGLVAALAWNNVIKEAVEVYLKPLIGKGSGIISLLIYAILITILAVAITLQLSKLKEVLKNNQSNN